MAFPLQFFLETVVLPNLLMAKDKKKKQKKAEVSEDILDVAALSIKKFRKVTREIGKLSTGQKLVGGIALAAAGLAYLATQETEAAAAAKAPKDDNSDAAPQLPASSATTAAPRHKSRKASKAKSAAGPESED